MELVFGALLFLAGVTMVVWSVHVTRAAAPERRIPLFRATLRRPVKATLLQGLAVGLGVLSGFLAMDAFGGLAVLAPLLVGAAWLVAVVLHNRRVEHEYRPQKTTAL